MTPKKSTKKKAAKKKAAKKKASVPDIPVVTYIHIAERIASFKRAHPSAVIFDNTLTNRADLLTMVPSEGPVFVCNKQGVHDANDLIWLKLAVFYNGKAGQLVGVRDK